MAPLTDGEAKGNGTSKVAKAEPSDAKGADDSDLELKDAEQQKESDGEARESVQ